MHKFSVWVDADSFPAKARDFIVSHASSKQVPILFVANHEIKSDAAKVKMMFSNSEYSAVTKLANNILILPFIILS